MKVKSDHRSDTVTTAHTSRPVKAGMGVHGLILPKLASTNTVFYEKLAKAVRNYPCLYDKSRLR